MGLAYRLGMLSGVVRVDQALSSQSEYSTTSVQMGIVDKDIDELQLLSVLLSSDNPIIRE